MRGILLIASVLGVYSAFGQIDTFKTIYKDIPTLSCYRVKKALTVKNGDTTYTLEGNVVHKQTFDKFTCEFAKCKPCLLELYDINGHLVRKGVTYGDCWSGPFVDYYTNGSVKLMGQYKQNTSGDWENHACIIKEGKWKYFNEKGKLVKTEHWENDILQKTVVPQ